MRKWQVVFWAASAYNVLVGLPMLISPRLAYQNGGMPPPVSLIEPRFGGLCILIFALGYALIAWHPWENLNLLRMLLVSKLGAFGLMLIAFLAGEANRMFLALGVVDLIWAGIFAVFLVSAARSDP